MNGKTLKFTIDNSVGSTGSTEKVQLNRRVKITKNKRKLKMNVGPVDNEWEGQISMLFWVSVRRSTGYPLKKNPSLSIPT